MEATATTVAQGEVKTTTRTTNFTIEHILQHAGRKETGQPTQQMEIFDWLHCTRYRPPKLNRSKKKEGCVRRKLGRNPRIPFSAAQVAILEDKFRVSPYLSTSDVGHLSTLLRLSETRIKIWFQNRRARERRDHGRVDVLSHTPPPRSSVSEGPIRSAFSPPTTTASPSTTPVVGWVVSSSHA